jgi:F-type H+-transporting ATPase subunit delta
MAMTRRRATPTMASFHSSASARNEEADFDPLAATHVNLNFAHPSGEIYKDTEVELVIIPGVTGEYGVTAGHTPIISEMKPGLVQIYHKADDKEPEKYFVSGGFAFTHLNSTTDIACVEAVPLEEIDADRARAGLKEFQDAFDRAAADSLEAAEAQIGLDVHSAMVTALEE